METTDKKFPSPGVIVVLGAWLGAVMLADSLIGKLAVYLFHKI